MSVRTRFVVDKVAAILRRSDHSASGAVARHTVNSISEDEPEVLRRALLGALIARLAPTCTSCS